MSSPSKLVACQLAEEFLFSPHLTRFRLIEA